MKPRPWSDVYPQGTKEGDEEQAFFTALSRNKEVWPTTDALAHQTGLSKQRIDEIINKYIRRNMVFQHERHDNKWAYWERVPDRVVDDPISLKDKDHKDRINKLKQGFGDSACDMSVWDHPSQFDT